MPLSGMCQICGKISHALSICPYCGCKACINCLNPQTGACKRCQGKVLKK